MVNDIFDWITIALYDKFGENYTYYVEEVEQGASRPCFVVGALNPIIKRTNPVRYDRVFPIAIHYFSDKDNASQIKRDCYDVAEKLIESLEEIRSTDKQFLVRGYDMSWEITENVLQFFITYRFYVYKVEEVDLMEEGSYRGSPIPKLDEDELEEIE